MSARSQADLKVAINFGAFRRVMAAISAGINSQAPDAMKAWARDTLKGFQRARIMSGGGGGVRNRTGNLKNSFRSNQDALGTDFATAMARIWTECKYARVLDTPGGRTIRPVRRKFLAIPIDPGPAVFRSGRPRFGFSLYDTLPADRGFHFQDFQLRPSKGKAWYNLARSVRIPQKLFFRDYIKAHIVEITTYLGDRIRKWLKR